MLKEEKSASHKLSEEKIKILFVEKDSHRIRTFFYIHRQKRVESDWTEGEKRNGKIFPSWHYCVLMIFFISHSSCVVLLIQVQNFSSIWYLCREIEMKGEQKWKDLEFYYFFIWSSVLQHTFFSRISRLTNWINFWDKTQWKTEKNEFSEFLFFTEKKWHFS